MQVYTEIKPVSMSEKYDGVQGCWTGQELVTRTGGKINAPAWWTDGLPEKALVGELWIGRGEFEAVKALVQSGRSEGWERVCFMVFDGAGNGFALWFLTERRLTTAWAHMPGGWLKPR